MHIIQTADGTSSVASALYDATYHSSHGALTESMHVFINEGLKAHQLHSSNPSIRIFEMGFGTGLNALLSLIHSREQKISIHYEAVELHPMNQDLISQLNYHDHILEASRKDILSLHQKADELIQIDDYFKLQVHQTSLEEYNPTAQFDIIYYDAFGPGAQPELWELEILTKVVQLLLPGGLLITYCAQGAFKRHLRSLGLEVVGRPGPPGKREITQGWKK